jgi:hypothetical protein
MARSLQTDCRAGEAEALARLASAFPSADGARLLLAKALAVIAREHGYPSWPRLKAEVERRLAAAKGKGAAKAVRSAEKAAIVEVLCAELTELASSGDPVAVARRRPLGRTLNLAVRDQIASRPQVWAKLVDLLIAGLGHSNPAVRHSCAHDLDTYDDGRAIAALAPLIDDPVPRVRSMAMHALVCDACKAAPQPWARDICRRVAARALTDASVNVRRHAVVHIARCEPALAVQTLTAVLEREADERTRRQAQLGLKQLRGRPPMSPVAVDGPRIVG